MAIADLSLALSVQSSGTAEVDKLVSVLNKYYDKVEDLRKQKPPDKSEWDRFGEGVRNAIQNPMQAAGDAAKGLLDKIGPVGGALAAAAGAFTVAGVAAFNVAQHMGELGLSIQNTALRMGLSTKEVGEFTYAAKLAGGDIRTLEGAMRKLSVGLADSSEDGEKARRGLAALGVSARDASGELRPTNDIFLDISKGLSQMSNAAERNTAAIQIFGRAGVELIPVLTSLSDNVAKAKEMDLGLDDKTVQGLEDAHKELSGIEARWAALARQPKIALTLELSALLKWFRGDNKDDKGPMTPGEKAVERHWAEYEASPQGKIDVLKSNLAMYENRTDPLAVARAANLRAQIAALQDLASGTGKRILDKALAGGGAHGLDEQLKAARKNLDAIEVEARGLGENKGGVASDVAQNMALRLADARRTVDQLERAKKYKPTPPLQVNMIHPIERTRHPSLLRNGIFGDTFYATGENAPIGGEGFAGQQHAYGEGLIEERRQQSAADLDAARMETSYRISKATAMKGDGPGSDIDLAKQVTQLKLDGLQREIDLGQHLYDAQAQALQLRREGELEIYQIQQKEYEQAQHDSEQRAQEMASGVFAGLTNRKGPGAGFQEYGLGMLNELERGVFVNLTKDSFEQLGKTLGQAGGAVAGGSKFLGGLLKGTLFDPEHGKDPVKPSIDAAKLSVDALKVSVDALISALGGTPPAGSGAAGGVSGLLNFAGPYRSTANSVLQAFSTSGSTSDYGSVPTTSLDEAKAMGLALPALGAVGGVATDLASGGGSGDAAVEKSAASAANSIGNFLKSSSGKTLMTDVGKGVTAGFEIYQGIKTGGAKGGLEIGAGGLTAASMIPGPQQPFLMAGAAVLSMVQSMFGDPKLNRQKGISNELTDWHYFQPQALSSFSDGSGDLMNYDARGNVRNTGYDAWRFNVTQSHYGSPISGQPTPIPGSAQPVYIYAMDAQSFAQFASNNRGAIANSQYQAIQEGHPLVQAIRAATGTA